MTIFGLRSSEISKRVSTPEQHRKVWRPNPDGDDLHNLGSYTRTEPILQKDKKVEELKLLYEFEIKGLGAEMERTRAEQRRLQTEDSCPDSEYNQVGRGVPLGGKGSNMQQNPNVQPVYSNWTMNSIEQDRECQLLTHRKCFQRQQNAYHVKFASGESVIWLLTKSRSHKVTKVNKTFNDWLD